MSARVGRTPARQLAWLRALLALGLAYAGCCGLSMSWAETAAPLPATRSPEAWAEELARAPAGRDWELPHGALSIVIMQQVTTKQGIRKLRVLKPNPSAWQRLSFTRSLDPQSVEYSLSLNPASSGEDEVDEQSRSQAYAESILLAGGVQLVLDVTGSIDGGVWRLWTWQGLEAALLHAAPPPALKGVSRMQAWAHFVRSALGYDAVVQAVDGDQLLLMGAAENLAAYAPSGLVLAGSAPWVRIDDERERPVSVLLRLSASQGYWHTARLLAAPQSWQVEVGSKVVLAKPQEESGTRLPTATPSPAASLPPG